MDNRKEKPILRKKVNRIQYTAGTKGYTGIFGITRFLCQYIKASVADLLARHCPVPGLREFMYRQMGVKIGKGTDVAGEVYFDKIWPELITIGEGCGIVPGTVILAHHRDLEEYGVGDHVHDMPYIVKPIKIGNHVSIGANSVILPGVTIGDGVIVGAGSIVRHDVDSYTLVAGNPAKVIKDYKENTGKKKN